jgi:hypothetical protein
VPTATSTAAPQDGSNFEGGRALTIASYGAYLMTAYLTIGRLNSSGLTGTFLMNSALRAAIGMMLAFAAGAFGLFSKTVTSSQADGLYFIVGLFPLWALDYVRQRARDALQRDEQGCDSLPVCLIEGIDDGILDRLSEAGIWDIQHLAAADPLDVSRATLYPLPRVADWKDQAMLIQFVRRRIVAFRSLGITGASGLAALYGESIGVVTDLEAYTERMARAAAILTSLAEKSEMPIDAVKSLGRRLLENRHVELLWSLWRPPDSKPIYVAAVIGSVYAAIKRAAIASSLELDDPLTDATAIPATTWSLPVFPQQLELALRNLGGGFEWSGSVRDLEGATTWGRVVELVLGALTRKP